MPSPNATCGLGVKQLGIDSGQFRGQHNDPIRWKTQLANTWADQQRRSAGYRELPVRAQTAEEQERSYRLEAMEQALQTKQHFDLYGLHFDSNKATIQPESKSLLDDIVTALKNFPDWHLRIIGHTDSTGDSEHNVHLSLDRAIAIEAALVDRGVDRQRLVTAGLGEVGPLLATPHPMGVLLTAGLNSSG